MDGAALRKLRKFRKQSRNFREVKPSEIHKN